MIRLVQKSTDKVARKYWTDEITEMSNGLKFSVKTKTGADLDVFLNYSEIAEVVKSSKALNNQDELELGKSNYCDD